MPLWTKRVADLDSADIDELLIGPSSEGRELEFKRDLPTDHLDFLAQVSSIANAIGGHLFFGVATEKGTVSEIPGVDVPDWDALRLRFENILRDGLQPRLPLIEMNA